MTIRSHVQQLLKRAAAVLPSSDEELIYKGIAAGVSERIIELKKAEAQLQKKHGSLNMLEQRIQTEGISPDDHTLYTDLIEWQAIHHELTELLNILRTM